jgi:methyl-accepting chemotaxis protein
MKLSNFKLRTKLIGGFAIVLALATAQSLFGVLELQIVNDKSTEISQNWLPSVRLTGDMNTNASDFRIAQLQHVLADNEAAMVGFEKEIDSLKEAFERKRSAYVKLISSDEERKLYDAFDSEWKRYLAFEPELLELSRAQKAAEAQALINGEARKAFDAASASLLKLMELNHAGADQASKDGDALYAEGTAVALGALALMVLLGGATGWVLSRDIGRGVNQAKDAAKRIADGDLTVTLNIDGSDEVAQLLQALTEMKDKLTHTVSGVRSNADSVATASAQIAQGNNDLSQRTEQQASALEETAASMEELGSTVKQNADNARQANQLALSASTVAVKGGEVVSQVVTTMKGINDSSKKIADIISVIDGIAFQTNILALNAAVEAARAGEQGRGFAVVASEVRSLAGRSADAAKEIKGLINASVERVEQGTALVDQAGATMTEVVNSIKRVTDIMGEISAASTEQSAGVAQVGEAVSQMDQATQQNAALVEESAAAAESLKGQAQQLVSAVAVFKLASGAAVSPVAVTTTPAPSYAGSERRGPDRAKNVTRPTFGTKAQANAKPKATAKADVPTLTAEVSPAKTGTDDEWTSF